MKKFFLCWRGILSVLAVFLIFSGSAASAQEQPAVADENWQTVDTGPAEEFSYSFNTDTIKYDRSADGSINKNIIVYQEKKTNVVSISSEFNFYSITECKLNVNDQSILFGEESFYTKTGEFRHKNTPFYMIWLTVKPETIGGIRFITLVEYARAHDGELTARS